MQPMFIIYNIFAFILFCFICTILHRISMLINEKRNEIYIKNTESVRKESKLDLGERLDVTTDLLNLCNVLIDNEIMKTIQTYTRLKSKYEYTRIDKDSELISKSVFEAIKPEIISNKDLIIKQDYIMQHIVDETILRLISITQEYNQSLLNTAK